VTAGAVATPHALATQAGAAALRAGGSAVDAALAAAATVAVVYPHMNAIGGDVMALLHAPDGGVTVVNGSGAAAAAVDPDALGDVMPARGVAPITVPGAVRAWETLHGLGARLPWAALFSDAIACARDGVEVAPSLARALDGTEVALDVGGGRLRQPALARTLSALADDGADALYGGPVGAALVGGLQALGSPLVLEDLAAHRSEVVAPLRGRYRGEELLTAPPNSQGHVLLEVAAALELYDDPVDAAFLARLFALAGADRDRWLADPRTGDVPIAWLLSGEHAVELLDGARAALGPAAARRAPARPTGDTIAVVAADADGWAVSLIQSVFWAFGSGIVEPATGILCHNRGASFTLRPGSPNRLAGGRRPLHTLMPVLTRRDGRLTGVHGTMGGHAQPQIHLQLLARLLDGASPQEAIAAPRFTVYGDLVEAESPAPPGLPVDVDLGPRSEAVGHAQLIRIAPDGAFAAASDPRADGTALAV
jgi:gamma-glutamyltranspeptidase/glutathione hydrolase